MKFMFSHDVVSLRLFSNPNYLHFGKFLKSFLFVNAKTLQAFLFKNYYIEQRFAFFDKIKGYFSKLIKTAALN